MLLPACCLAGAVTVVGKLTLSAAVQVGLMTETVVANLVIQTGGKSRREGFRERKVYGLLEEGPDVIHINIYIETFTVINITYMKAL